MALETAVYSQDPFSHYTFKDLYSTLLVDSHNNFGYNNDHHHVFYTLQNQEVPEFGHDHMTLNVHVNDNCTTTKDDRGPAKPASAATTTGRQKRRRAQKSKNKEELETQRMTHITTERNRRRQMNDYLAALRSLMPPSYVQRGDQASIIEGAINFVKELEQSMQSIETNNNKKNHDHDHTGPILTEFLTFPPYTTCGNLDTKFKMLQASESQSQNTDRCNNQLLAAADIEVRLVETHANLKVLAKRQPKQLLRLVAGLEGLCFGILHLNVTSAEQMVLYSISLKIEEGCQLCTVDEIATAVNQMLRRIQEESLLLPEIETV